VDGDPVELTAGDAVFIPKNARHRLANHRPETVEVVFALAPLAPRPELGHVETELEQLPETD
jgi:putative monooxygenase